jgi:uncharacterized Ntn-hydrolase superfamily protein
MLLSVQGMYGQDTFSICAVDSATGQVGSAGATCITSASTSAIIISDVHPGRGVIHTQSYWLASNQSYGRTLMNLGTLSPSDILDSLVLHDAQSNSTLRQYGAVDLDSGGRSAAFTGVNCMNYKNHITGPGYAIQGNILLGQQVLDSMEARFLNTPGTLACRLMAAIQGAKIAGADTRCMSYGISSFSAFIRVANPTDSVNALYLDLTVNTYPSGGEPIDSLQNMFDTWGGCTATGLSPVLPPGMFRVFPNPARETIFLPLGLEGTLELIHVTGVVALRMDLTGQSTDVDISGLDAGIYFLMLRRPDGRTYSSRILKLAD